MKVFVIGGGASGMVAALTAARDKRNQVTVLERQNRVGRKLLATGNGRCNLTNLNADASHYHTDDARFVTSVLSRFTPKDALNFFADLGLYTVEAENGKVYPLSDMANSVVDTLRFSMEQAGVTVLTSRDVLSVAKKASGYEIATTDGNFYADKIILAAGGCAGKTLGGTRSGYHLAESLGHGCTPLFPALVQLKTDVTYIRSLKGVRALAAVTLKGEKQVIAQSRGEVQFTDFGVSGPAAFEISRAASVFDGEKLLLLDFMPDFSEEDLFSALKTRCARFPDLETEQLLTGMLNNRLGQTLAKYAGVSLQSPLSALTEEELQKIAHTLKFFAAEVQGVLGMEHAQVTAGGIPLAEVRSDTLESRKAKGIFLCGEVLNVDGDCGGYNLQWAWASGCVAGHLGTREDGV